MTPRRGAAAPDDDDLAEKYELADDAPRSRGLGLVRGVQLGAGPSGAGAGTTWATGRAATGGASVRARTRTSAGVRWWNVKHPAAYADRIAAGVSPAKAREVLDPETRRVERVLLETRLVTGLSVSVLDAAGRDAVPDLISDGLVELCEDVVLRLTTRGRLLADAVVRALLP